MYLVEVSISPSCRNQVRITQPRILAAHMFQLIVLLVFGELVSVSWIIQRRHVHLWFQPCQFPVYESED